MKRNKKRQRDSDDEGDNSRRGGPSAGGPFEGGPSEGTGGSSGGTGGSSGGVEGSSKVKSESPLDFVIEKESLELPFYLDDLE